MLSPTAPSSEAYIPLLPLTPLRFTTELNEGTQKPKFTQKNYTFLLRLIAFIILELAFIVLASTATVLPIPLNLPTNISLSAAKGILTLILLLWQVLAIFCVTDIVLRIFSSEWAVQYRRLGKAIPRKIDVVSRMTAGLFQQVRHFSSSSATLRYRLAFVSSILLTVVHGLGPSAITVNSVYFNYPSNISVAHVDFQEDLWGRRELLDHAETIVKMELLEHTTYGFQTVGGNVLIPWPPQDLLSANGTIRYHTDVVTYNFSCSWRQPTMGNFGAGRSVVLLLITIVLFVDANELETLDLENVVGILNNNSE